MRLSHHHWLAGERHALRRARLVIANSQRTRADLIERVDVDARRIRVIYYGIDAAQFRAPSPGERDATRAELGWPGTRPVVLFVGGLGDRRKGFDTLFDAWIVLAREKNVEALLVVIGQGSQLAEWRRRAAAAGLSDCITFLGFREDVPRLMRAADALVSPTRYEAYGLGVHEALCCGLPALVSADAGVAEQYPPELSALLLPDADDPDDLADRLEACIGGQAAPHRAMEAFAARLQSRSWDDMAGDIVAAASEE
jgi:glycosyltransferase involved in cell wall biosynthesis